jgi:hypothetical protein
MAISKVSTTKLLTRKHPSCFKNTLKLTCSKVETPIFFGVILRISASGKADWWVYPPPPSEILSYAPEHPIHEIPLIYTERVKKRKVKEMGDYQKKVRDKSYLKASTKALLKPLLYGSSWWWTSSKAAMKEKGR